MSDPSIVREVVGVLADRRSFEAAVKALQAEGFQHADLSILSSHQSLDAAFAEPDSDKSIGERLLPLLGEMKYETPIVAAGLIALASGPTGAAIAALVAAGVGGMAVKELLDEIAAEPQRADFEKALKAGGILMWVAVGDALAEEKAKAALQRGGAQDIHVHESRREDGPAAG